MVISYSAAQISEARKRTFARSSNPGLLGSKWRKTSRGMPAASALRKISSRRQIKSWVAIESPPKSLAATTHLARSSVISGASSSFNSTTEPSSYSIVSRAIVSPFAAIRLPQRYNAFAPVSQSEHTNEKTAFDQTGRDRSALPIVKPKVRFFLRGLPFHPRSITQTNPMLRAVGGVFGLVPFKFHRRDESDAMVNISLQGAIS